jgi:PAS domain S-box-containing protein
VGVSIRDKEGYFLDMNEAGCRFLGYSHDELIGTHFSQLTHPEDR